MKKKLFLKIFLSSFEYNLLNKHGEHLDQQMWMVANSYGTGDWGGNFSGKHGKDE